MTLTSVQVKVVEERGADGVVGLLRGVRIAAEAQGPVVVGQGDAQGARGVEVADLVSRSQVTFPSQAGGVDQVGGPTERGDLRQDSVDGGLQGELQRVEVSCQGQRGVHRGLLDEGQQGRCDELAHVGGRGPEVHRR